MSVGLVLLHHQVLCLRDLSSSWFEPWLKSGNAAPAISQMFRSMVYDQYHLRKPSDLNLLHANSGCQVAFCPTLNLAGGVCICFPSACSSATWWLQHATTPPPLCLTKHVYHPNRSWDVLGHNSSNHESIWNLSTYRESVQCHESLCSQQSGWMLSPKLISNWIRLILLWRYLFGLILIIPLGFLGEGWEIFETTNQPRYPSRISKASKRMRNQSR